MLATFRFSVHSKHFLLYHIVGLTEKNWDYLLYFFLLIKRIYVSLKYLCGIYYY